MSYAVIVFSRLLAYHLSALALSIPPPLARAIVLGLVLVHALALGIGAYLARAPLWLVGIGAVIFFAAQFSPRARAIFSPALLAPFWFVYAAIVARFVWLRLARGDVPGYFEYALPDARVLLRFEFLVGAAICYSALILGARFLPPRGRALGIIARLGIGALCIWASAEFFGQRALGATGSDPYAYVQMGVDFVTRGSFAHRFELFPLIASKSIEWFPLLHVGYRLPYNALGDAITVWSPGGALAFALAYAAGGENGLYLVNPLFSLSSALAAALLAWELARRETKARRIVIASSVAALLLTSYEIVNWAGVTMVDTQALVFSTLALYAALRVQRGGAWHWALLAGIFWGAAYQVRHTQLVILCGMLPLFFLASARRQKLGILFASAFAVAVPDLWYHQTYLGGWLTPESQELALFSLNAMLPTLGALGQSAFIAAEFGWFIFFIASGIIFFARRARIENAALLLWLGAALLIHLPYPALRLRDLIPQFPIIAFYVSFGIVALVGALWTKRRGWANLAAACVIFFALEWSLARVWHTLPRAFDAAPPRFGAMTQAQRAAFDELARLTPSNAIVGASLNSGAIDLYARRAAFRPADWSAQALEEFLVVTQGEKRAVFILEDNAALSRVLENLRAAYSVERVGTLDAPLFGAEPIANPGALWKIESKS